MTGKEIIELKMVDPETRIRGSIKSFIEDVIDVVLCEEVYDKICDERGLTEETVDDYSFYDDPIWKDAWNKKVSEIADALKL